MRRQRARLGLPAFDTALEGIRSLCVGRGRYANQISELPDNCHFVRSKTYWNNLEQTHAEYRTNRDHDIVMLDELNYV